MAAGVVLSSFQVEGFSLERTVRLSQKEIAGRLKVNGAPDRATFDKLLQTAQNLRAEAAGLK